MRFVRPIELLAPARNLATGMEAINHGADAVYIGAPRFSARAEAGNSTEDIRKLATYAHLFHAKVYAALNTILTDSELPEVGRMIEALYRAGVDAVIIQDMGILTLDLPPVAFHASTQTDNRSVEKVRFLEEAGFSQVVLARELSLSEIRTIASQTRVALEVFVHGALCTSFSGQCYISQALTGRSANRGECAQCCRFPYTLQDANGHILASGKHLLSLKDLNLSEHLEALLDAGVSSFKIEGRLKDTAYVKNVTAYYRKKLDAILARRPEFKAASSGETVPYFIPDPQKSFNRGFSSYFLHGRNRGHATNIASPETPKSLGEVIGTVKDLSTRFFTLNSTKCVHNGDGLCFINERKELQGFRVNRVEGNRIFPAEMLRLHTGLLLYRNRDAAFEKSLSQKSAERKIGITLTLDETPDGFSLAALDDDDYRVCIAIAGTKELAQKKQQANQEEQLTKLGNTPFKLNHFSNRLKDDWFIPSSTLSKLRQRTVEALLNLREAARQQQTNWKKIPLTRHPYPETALTYSGNVYNEKAKAFYRQHGVKTIDPAFEALPRTGTPVMTTKYCLRYQWGYCPERKGKTQAWKEPLTLCSGKNRWTVCFDCVNCEMQIIKEN
jgi:putative protease